jgi:hypothetical protein
MQFMYKERNTSITCFNFSSSKTTQCYMYVHAYVCTCIFKNARVNLYTNARTYKRAHVGIYAYFMPFIQNKFSV